MTQQKKITIAQSINIAKDIAIARHGQGVTVEAIGDLVEEVYIKLFKGVATEVYLNTEPKNEEQPLTLLDKEQLLEELKRMNDPVGFRSEHLNSLKALGSEDKEAMKKAIKNFKIK